MKMTNSKINSLDEAPDDIFEKITSGEISGAMSKHIKATHNKLRDWVDNSPALESLCEDLFKSHGLRVDQKIFEILPRTGLIGIVFSHNNIKYKNSSFMIARIREMKHTPLARGNYVEEAKGIIMDVAVDIFDDLDKGLESGEFKIAE